MFFRSKEGLSFVSKGLAKIYHIVWDKLSRFLIIFKKAKYTAEQFTPEDILAFREFVINEYKYEDKYEKKINKIEELNVFKACKQNKIKLDIK